MEMDMFAFIVIIIRVSIKHINMNIASKYSMYTSP